MGVVSHREACPKCRSRGKDTSGDNLVIYVGDGGSKCFACGYGVPSEGYIEEGIKELSLEDIQKMNEKRITQEQYKAIKSITSFNDGYRGITKETNQFYGVRMEYDESTGDPIREYYPTTLDYKMAGYKPRELPKAFGKSLGLVGSDCDFFGEWKFQNPSQYQSVLIVGGEIDARSAFQALRDDQIKRGKEQYEPTAVVSSTIGESGTVLQAKKRYKWLDKFGRIYIGLDNDDAGKEATKKLIEVLPKGKVFLVTWSKKDPNSILTSNDPRRIVSDFFSAQKYTPTGIVGSGSLMPKIIENAKTPRVPLPPFMHKLQRMMAGGIPLGYIINIGAFSGIGKTSYINEMVYYWVFNSPHKVGAVSMELDSGQYGEVVLSRHMERKISLIEDTEQRVDYLESEAVQVAGKELFYNEDGTDRWHLLDDRDGTLEDVKRVVEELIIVCECKLIVLDPVQDLLDGLSNDEQAVFMRWQKSMIKSHKVSFVNINHTRKSPSGNKSGGQGGWITEEDFSGSSSIFKSGGANILLMRDKYAEDEIEKNTTIAVMSKCRWTGITGEAGRYFYENKTHKLFDLDYYLDNIYDGSDSKVA